MRKPVRRQTSEEWRLIYDAFLRSPAWHAKRKRVLQRANARCESCLSLPASQVHHVVYPVPLTTETLTTQPAWQLRAVCVDCHKRVHAP